MPRGKKQCPSCEDLVATRASCCSCGHIFTKKKDAKPKTTKPKTTKPKTAKPKISKIDILERLVEEPKNNKNFFYAREMKMLNDLVDLYSLEFMNVVNLGRRFESLAYFKHSKVKEKLDRRFREFNYVTDKSRYPEYNLGEKSGEDRFVKRKKKTLKDFLEEE